VAFPSRPLQLSEPGYRIDRLRPVLVVGGVLVLGAVLLAVIVPGLGSNAGAMAPDSTAEGAASERSRATPAVRVLNPGDAVQVDSLSRGWYRVLIDGHPAGYVHRSNLDPVSAQR
jgi:hypothetical protein